MHIKEKQIPLHLKYSLSITKKVPSSTISIIYIAYITFISLLIKKRFPSNVNVNICKLFQVFNSSNSNLNCNDLKK